MQTDSSARRTYLASRSASEWTTTVLMPISRHARWMRSAISPRLAIRIFSNSLSVALAAAALVRATKRDRQEAGRWVARECGVAELRTARAGAPIAVVADREREVRRRARDHAMTNSGCPNSTGCPFSVRIALIDPGLVGLDLVHELHRLDDAQRLSFRHAVAHLDEGLRAGRRRAVERAHHRALDDVAFRDGRRRLGRRRGRRRTGRGNRHHLRHRGDRNAVGARPVGPRDPHALLALLDLELRDAGRLDELNQRFELAQIHVHHPFKWARFAGGSDAVDGACPEIRSCSSVGR